MLLKNFALCFTVLIGLGLFLCGIATAQDAWTQFRGPDGSGESENDSLSLIVDPKVDAKWRTEVPGSGWSTPVTDGNVIWMTAARVTEATAEQRAAALADVQLADMKDVAGSVRCWPSR